VEFADFLLVFIKIQTDVSIITQGGIYLTRNSLKESC